MAIVLWQTVATSQTLTDEATGLELNVERIADTVCILFPAQGRTLSECTRVPTQLMEMTDSRLAQGDDPTNPTVFVIAAELGGAQLFGTIIGSEAGNTVPMSLETAQIAFDVFWEAVQSSTQAVVRSGPEIRDVPAGPVSQFIIERWDDHSTSEGQPTHQVVYQFFGPGWFFQADFRFGGDSSESFLPLVEAVISSLRVPEWTIVDPGAEGSGVSFELWVVVGVGFVCLIGLFVWLRSRK